MHAVVLVARRAVVLAALLVASHGASACASSSSRAPAETTAGNTDPHAVGANAADAGDDASMPSGHAHAHGHGIGAPSAVDAGDPVSLALDDVTRIHGAPGPWAVSGYRMAQYALAKLRLERGSFDLEITHRTPRLVQFSCIADGAAAYSGASAGKLNLSLVEVPEADLVTVYRNKRTGNAVALRPSAAFRSRYLNADRARARELGREVMLLPDDQVFEEVPLR